MALYLAKRGHDVAVHYASSRDDAQRLVDEIRALGRKSDLFAGDLTNEADLQAVADAQGDLKSDMIMLRAKNRMLVHEVLTEEQKAKMSQMKEKFAKRHPM